MHILFLLIDFTLILIVAMVVIGSLGIAFLVGSKK